MASCERCQPQLLNYLYDLLEPDERRDVEEHVRTCPSCQAGLGRAKSAKGVLADAAKGTFADVAFKAPRVVAKARAKGVATERRPRKPFYLSRWAVAAALLLAVLSATSVLAVSIYKYEEVELSKARERLARAKEDLRRVNGEVNAQRTKAREEIDAIRQQIDALVTDWNKASNEKRTVHKQKQVQFEIRGPKNLQAGAPNVYDIEVKPQAGAPPALTRSVRAQVVDQKTDKVLHERQLALGKSQLRLPPDLPIKPGDDLALVLLAETDAAPVSIKEHLSLVFPEYVTHLTTDKPMYRPGETVRFRSLTLDRFSLRPAHDDLHLRYKVLGPNNVELFKADVMTKLVTGKDKDVVKGPDGEPLRGLGAGEFRLPDHLAGGQYVLAVSEANERFPAEARHFIVHRWQAPRYNKEANFHRTSYSPGDKVVLQGRVTPLAAAMPGAGAAGGPPAGGEGAPLPPAMAGGGMGMPGGGTAVTLGINATVDNQVIFRTDLNPDPDGTFRVEFQLPGGVTKGHGTVTVEVRDGGNVETLVRVIPIIIRDLFVDFYPEGGDLIAGVQNRVYFHARTPIGKPADVRGRVVDQKGSEVARVETLTDDAEPGINQGLGIFSFVPQVGFTYELKLDSPIGIRKKFLLPKAKPDGVVLSVPRGVVDRDIEVVLLSPKKDRDLLVGAYCRGKLLDHTPIAVRADQPAKVLLKPSADVGGVYRITVFEKRKVANETQHVPLAERLIFRRQNEKVRVAVRPDRDAYAPGDRVQLHLEARNEKKEHAPAIAMVAVLDSSVTKLADEKTARALPTHFLLTTEVNRPEDLENADALLGTHPKAARALDLLLGAQGWRRFAEQDPQKLVKAQPPQRRGRPPVFLAMATPVARPVVDDANELAKVDEQFVGQFVTMQQKLRKSELQETGTPEQQQRLNNAQVVSNSAEERVRAEEGRLEMLRNYLLHGAAGLAFILLLLGGFFLVQLGLYRMASGSRGLVWLIGGLVLLGGLFFISVVGTFALIGLGDRANRFGQVGAMAVGVAPPAMDIRPPMAPIELMPAAPEFAPRIGPVEMPAEAEPIDQKQDERRAEAPGAMDLVVGGPAPMGGAMGRMMPGQPMPPFFGPMDDERMLRLQGRFEDITMRRMGRRVKTAPPAEPAVVREYAHQYKPASDQVRRDFTDVVYWHPAVILPGGKASLGFDLSDAVTRYEVLVVSHTPDGRLGADRIELAARLPYSVEPKVPVEVASNDIFSIPVAVANGTSDKTSLDLRLHTRGLKALEDPHKLMELGPMQTGRQLFRVRPLVAEGDVSVRFQARFAPKGADAIERSFKVVPEGFPFLESHSGVLEGLAQHQVVMPETWLPGSLQVKVQAFPSTLGDLQQGLDGLLREPHGCFEQSSSANYPNVMILNYLRESNQANVALEQRSRALMNSGYQKLTSFECQDPDNPAARRGYEWFGQTAPPHEALTAYGLLQFKDMARVYPVDEAMLKRTQQYLLDQRDGQGGFKRNPRAVDSFGRAPRHLTDAYVVWALTESGTQADLSTELNALHQKARSAKDPYFIALVALGHLNANKAPEAVELLKQVRTFQKDTGPVAGASTSITSSAGRDLEIETTALATLGWVKANRPDAFHQNVQRSARWLNQQRGGYGAFGSTQATVLALKALLAYTRDNQKAPATGELQVLILSEQGAAHDEYRVPITGREQGPVVLTLDQPQNRNVPQRASAGEDPLVPGRNTIQVSLTNQGNQVNTPLPYSVTVSYRTQRPASADDCPVRLFTSLSKRRAKEGETVKLTARLENRSGNEQGMTVAVVGLPGGLALPEDFQQLKDLAKPRDKGTKPGVISAWELRGRELVLYWRHLEADAKVDVELDLVCRLPGQFHGPAGRAYSYYNADQRQWLEPLQISIDPAP